MQQKLEINTLTINQLLLIYQEIESFICTYERAIANVI
jgi:hypothetical protein